MYSKNLFKFDRNFVLSSGRKPENFCLIGIDEAGRGPWAGPVVASACVLPPGFTLPRLNDSKKCSPSLRAKLFAVLKKKSLWATAVGSVGLIDSKNILRATLQAMKNAFQNLLRKYPHIVPDLVLVDGPASPDFGFSKICIPQGDTKSASIAAASIIAKVCRDRMMLAAHQSFPEYGFAFHKGYGTKLHQENLLRYGPSPIHRRSFAPVREWVNG